MYHKHHITKCLAFLVLAGPLASESRGDFVLWNDMQLTVNTYHSTGRLYDRSTADFYGGSAYNLYAYDFSTVNMPGGSVYYLYAYNSSTVNMSGGLVNNLYAYNSSNVNISVSGQVSSYLVAYDNTAVNMSGGVVYNLYACGSSTADMSGGVVSFLYARDSTAVNLSGGQVNYLYANDTSTTIFNARDFHLRSGLSLDGDRVLGTGMLDIEWFNGTRRTVNITAHDSGATIWVPEPATLALLSLGAVELLARRRNRRSL